MSIALHICPSPVHGGLGVHGPLLVEGIEPSKPILKVLKAVLKSYGNDLSQLPEWGIFKCNCPIHLLHPQVQQGLQSQHHQPPPPPPEHHHQNHQPDGDENGQGQEEVENLENPMVIQQEAIHLNQDHTAFEFDTSKSVDQLGLKEGDTLFVRRRGDPYRE